jgi:hypothetical protein
MEMSYIKKNTKVNLTGLQSSHVNYWFNLSWTQAMFLKIYKQGILHNINHFL